MKYLSARVKTRDSFRHPGDPICFEYNGETHEVRAIMEHWKEARVDPSMYHEEFYRIEAQNRQYYILRYSVLFDSWWIRETKREKMIIIPAIDLHEGQVVRLKKGKFDDISFYNKAPADVARAFEQAGATRIHVVDLDGSVSGRRVNAEAISSICSSVEVEVELGGGIRSHEDATKAFDLGVHYVILGTMVVEKKEASMDLIRAFPSRVGIGIDAVKGKVAIKGWKEITRFDAVEMARSYENAHPAFIVYTDISRDGMMQGPNIEETAALAQAVHTPVIASGGVSCLDDLIRLSKTGVMFGAITGKAMYEGKINLENAIKKIKEI
ncbi:MAG: 1-(5-phosphoribosyl)-5-[(5-phosphoribosylamino)methylideneamino]imidazole-4-carboxamide isomerase [Thermodesulfobacteriota bacterium]|nr:1-(5-phosphoribosyl)-5-[(5-phosphoribosylamino)methylideneamino]imidazole-4-carboxamide isomerase [Thermodesulfobacteriota bacterium]